MLLYALLITANRHFYVFCFARQKCVNFVLMPEGVLSSVELSPNSLIVSNMTLHSLAIVQYTEVSSYSI